jgi:hypothetical protein
MRSPEGDEFPGIGCYLETVPNQRLTWTSALAPGLGRRAEPLLAVFVHGPHGRPPSDRLGVRAVGFRAICRARTAHLTVVRARDGAVAYIPSRAVHG